MRAVRSKLLCLPIVGVMLLCLLGAAGCEDSDASVSFTPTFSPVTFTLDSSGKITFTVGRSFVTPIGVFAVDAGVEHQFAISPEGYLTAIFRYVSSKQGMVEAAYLVRTDRRVEPTLDGQELAVARGGELRIDMTDAEPGSRLTISDIPQDEPVPSASASSCADSGDVALVLPEVSAGDSVTDTVAKLSSACLQVQYASEAADVSEGTVTRVVVPTTVPDGSVQLPPAGDGSPGPGDKVTASGRQAATIYVAAPAEGASPTETSPSPSEDQEPTPSPTDPSPTATTTVHGEASAPVRSEPNTAGSVLSTIAVGGDYPALCSRQGEEVTAHGKTSAVWVQLRLQSGDTGWVTATALSGDPETVVPTLCGTELSD